MAATSLLLHVGLPKTGTTTLQGGLFTHLPRVEFVGKRADPGGKGFTRDWVPRFRDMVNYADSFHLAQAAPALSAEILATIEGADRPAVLVSLEGLTNPLVDTAYTQMKDTRRKAADAREILRPLDRHGIRVRVLIGLRNQVELLPSLFSQVYLQGFASGLYGPSYENFLDFVLDDPLIGFGHAFFYDQLLDHYHNLFGAENVTAVTMRGIFSEQPAPDVHALAEILEIDPSDCLALIGEQKLNVRATAPMASARRRMMTASPAAERLRQKTGIRVSNAAFALFDRLRIRRGWPVYRHVGDRSDTIRNYYAESNRRLKVVHGIDL